MIETRLFHYFLAVAREQNFTRAAKSLHISQSTLSKQMMDLEEHLGKKLFVRSKRHIGLTNEGIFFRSKAQEIMNLVERTENSFDITSDTVSGDVYIGCSETPTMTKVAKLFKIIHDDYPDINLHLYSGDAEDVLRKLNDGILDLAILLGPPTQEQFYYTEIPLPNSFGMLMLKEHPLAQKKLLEVADLFNYDLILPQQLLNTDYNRTWFGENFDKLKIVATYSLLYNATFLVKENLGIAFCLKDLVPTGEGTNFVFKDFTIPMETSLQLVSKKYKKQSTAVQLVKEFLEDWEYEEL